MSKELEAKDLQANFIKCFNELLTKTDKNIIVVNISREMAQNMVNLYEKYLTIKPSEALKYVNGKIADLEDDLQHYTMVEKDKCREFYIKEDLKQFTNIKQALLKSQEQEKIFKILFEKPLNALLFSEMKKGLDDYDELNYEEFSREMKAFYEEEGIEQFPTEEEFDLLKRCFNE